MGSLRNTRNAGVVPAGAGRSANRALSDHAAQGALEDFVTGVVGRLDLRTGVLELVNAGHVAPYLLRGTGSAAVELPVDLPLGLFPDTAYRSSRLSLEPGDRVVFVTDGMLERNAAGLDLPPAIAGTRGLHPREAVRALADRVLEATGRSSTTTPPCCAWTGTASTAATAAACTAPTGPARADRSDLRRYTASTGRSAWLTARTPNRTRVSTCTTVHHKQIASMRNSSAQMR